MTVVREAETSVLPCFSLTHLCWIFANLLLLDPHSFPTLPLSLPTVSCPVALTYPLLSIKNSSRWESFSFACSFGGCHLECHIPFYLVCECCAQSSSEHSDGSCRCPRNPCPRWTCCPTCAVAMDSSVIQGTFGVHWGFFCLWWIFWCAQLGGTQPIWLGIVSTGLHCPHLQLMSPRLWDLIDSPTTGSGRRKMQLVIACLV